MATEEKFEEAKRLYETANADQRYVLESLFPELAESEDDRIRKAVIYVVNHADYSIIEKTDFLATQMTNWLEKQGEQKHAWSEEDETTKNNISHIIRQYDKISKRENEPCWYIGDCLLWMQNIKDRVQPKQVLRDTFGYEDGRQFGKNEVLGNPEKYGLQRFVKWSKSDEEIAKEIDTIIHGTNSISDEVRKKLQDWLKSVKPHNTWKPSDEQMKALNIALRCGIQLGSWEEEALKSLKEQLKKLREE